MNYKRQMSFYMAGGMSGLSIQQQLTWRNRIKDMIQNTNRTFHNCSTYFFLPPFYYQPDGNFHKSEREAMEFDLYQLRRSDVVIVNFNVPQSIGTAMELAIARENKIPVIGLNEDNNQLHPWLKECCTRICDTEKELVQHIIDFYLN